MISRRYATSNLGSMMVIFVVISSVEIEGIVTFFEK